MNKLTLQAQIENSQLPSAFKKHLIACIKKGKAHRAHAALETDFGRVIDNMLAITTAAGRSVGLDADTLVRNTGFSENDLDADNFDGTIALLRGINHLANSGWSPITLLKPQKGTRTADLVVARGKSKLALDVACSSAGAQRDVDTLSKYMVGIANGKAEQLTNTIKTHSCTGSGLLFVLNSEAAVIWGHWDSYLESAKQAHGALNAADNYFISILTGRIAQVWKDGKYYEAPDDVVFPAWPNEAAAR